MEKDYSYSGMSTPEALEDFRTHFLSSLPRLIRFLVKHGVVKVKLTILCDGCGRREIIDGNAKLLPTNQWEGTEWTHQERLDFCEVCSKNGTAERAIADGAKPLGTYTFGEWEIH